MVYCNTNLKIKNNLNLNPNPNPNLYSNLYLNTNINLNVGRGYPWSTTSQFLRAVVIHGYPRLQFTFICLDAAILNICSRFLAVCGSAFFGLLSSSAIGLLFAALKQFDPVTK